MANAIVSPGFVPDRSEAPSITAGSYLAAARALGSPAFTISQLLRAPFPARARADAVLERAESLGATAAGSSPGCRLTTPLVSRPALELDAFPGRTVVIRALQSSSVKIYPRRFLPAFGPPRFALLPGHSTNMVHFPLDRAPGSRGTF
jgi:hypothetical protein